MKKHIILTVRFGSTRLPGKCLLPFSASSQRPELVLEHVINRAKNQDRQVIVCTGNQPSNNPIVQVCRENSVPFFCGNEDNKVARWLDCFNEFNLDWAHLLDADDPFFCNDEIEKSFEAFSLTERLTMATSKSRSGNASVGITLGRSQLTLMNDAVGGLSHFEMIEDLIDDIFQGNTEEISSLDPIPFGTRLTLDYFEDYLSLSAIKSLSDTLVSRNEINELLLENPWILKINSLKNIEWKARQEKILLEQRESNVI